MRRAKPSIIMLVAVALLALGCRSEAPRARLLVLGLDGMDPQVVDLLMAEGKMPHFAKLRQDGAYGRLLSSKPLLSPVIWTTIATGKTPDQHHIGHFVAVNQTTGEQLPVTSRMRRVKALWNILSDTGRTVDVVGWWASWPAETVRGSIVSDHLGYHFLLEEGHSDAQSSMGVTYPPDLAKSLTPLVTKPADLTPEQAAPFVDVGAAELSRPFD